MKRFLVALVLLLAPMLAYADSMPTVLTPACGMASSPNPLVAVGTLSASIGRNPQTGASYGLPASATCGAVTIRSNSGSAMTDTLPAAATYGAGFLWISNADSSATDTISGGFSGALQAGQNILLTSDGAAWSQAGGSFFPSASQARTNLGLGSLAVVNSPVPVANGGTGQAAAGATAANAIGALAEASNLSDLANAGTARTNLGLGTAATQNTGTSGANVPLLSTANTWTLPQTNTVLPVWPTQSANQIYAGPSSGSAAAPGFRSQVLADMPALAAGTGYCNATTSSAVPTACPELIHSLSSNFGAVGNGSTDDTTSLQNWINACQTALAVCFLDTPTSCYKTSSALSVTAALTIIGANESNTGLCPSSATQDAIDINTTGAVSFSNFNITPSITATAGSCISLTSATINVRSKFDHMLLSTCFIGITFTNAGNWIVDAAYIRQSVQTGIVSFGWGDSYLTNSEIAAGATANGMLLQGNCSGVGTLTGGLRVNGNKFNTSTTSTGIAILIDSATCTTQASALAVVGNSVEGYGTGISFVKGSLTALANVNINANEFALNGTCIQTDSAATWITSLVIDGNFCFPGASVGMIIGTPTNFTVTNNDFNMNASSSSAITVASGATTGLVANNLVFNTTGSPITNASTTTRIIDANGIAFSALPSAAANGSQMYVSSGVTNGLTIATCASGSSNAQAFRVNGAWDCF